MTHHVGGLPVFREYNSQYGSGMGNVLGGIMRMAVKRLQKSLVRVGARRLERVMMIWGEVQLKSQLARRRVVRRPVKRSRPAPTGSLKRKAKPRRTRDILS